MRSVPLLLSSVLALLCLFAGPGCSRGKKITPVEKLIAEGDKFYFAGDYDRADLAYKTALSHVSDDPKVLSRLGRLAYRQGRIVSGYLLLQGTLAKIGDDVDITLVYGLASHALARTSDARIAAKKVLERQPTNEEALILLVETGITTRDSQEAQRIIEQTRAAHPDSAPVHVALGMLHMLQREEAPAETEFRRAIQLDPKSAAAYSQLSFLLQGKGDEAGAKAALKQAYELSPMRSSRRIRYIDQLIQAGDTDGAQQALNEITKKTPDYVPAWTVKMKLLFQLGKYDESAAAADKVLDSDRANYDAWMQRVAIKLHRGDLDGVILDLEKVEGYFNKSPEVKYQLALVLFQKGEIFSAEQNLIQALRMSPNYDDAILLQGEIELRKGNTTAATVALRTYLKRRPQSVQARLLLAQVHRADREPGRALTVLEEVAKTVPKHPDARYFVGLTLLELDRVKEARESFEEALKLSPRYWPALEMLIEMDLVAGQTDAAKERVEGLLKKFPEASPLWMLRAKIRVTQNEVPGAEADLNQAIKLDPKTSYPYVLLSRIYLQTGRMQESLAKLSALVVQNPSANIWTQIGIMQGIQQNYEAAGASYEKAIELDPKYGPALNNLAILCIDRLNLITRAEDLVKRARDVSPGDPTVVDTGGWLLVRKGQFEGGLRLLQTASEKRPGDPEIRYHVGMAQYYLGLDDAAAESFRNVVAAATDTPVKKEASARLAVLDIDPAKATPAMKAHLENVVRTNPNDPIAFIRLADIELRDRQVDEASGHYEAALKITPRSTAALMALVELNFGPLKNAERAKELAKLARDAAPNDGQVAWRLGKLLFGVEEYNWANGWLQDAARIIVNNADVFVDLARSQYSVGRVPETAAALERAFAGKLSPATKAPAERMAAMLAAVKKGDPSDDDFAEARRILATEPKYVPAIMVEATAFEHQKKPEDARRSYERVLEIYPQFGPAMRQLAILWGEQLSDDAKAEDWARKALKLMPDDADASYQLGVVFYRRGEYEEAVRFLTQSVRRRGDQAATHFFLGMSYFQLKNNTECAPALKRALQLKLPPQETGEAMRVLEALARRGAL